MPTQRPAETELKTSTSIFVPLHECIEACMDSEKLYAIAAADVRDPTLTMLMHDYSRRRAEFVIAIQAAIRALGGFPENRGTTRGAAHRAFMGARMALEGRKDAVALWECDRGERRALAAYDRALTRPPDQALPPEVHQMLVEQRAEIEEAHKHILDRLIIPS